MSQSAERASSPPGGLQRIAHTTDFSPESVAAFEHALRLALEARCRLDILHVREHHQKEAWDQFPHVREVLVRWGRLSPSATPADIEPALGIHVSKVEIDHSDPVAGVSRFLLSHRPDLLVVATHGRHGINRWLHGSMSLDVVEHTNIPTLLIAPEGRGFVDTKSGAMSLRRVLLPLVPKPSPVRAYDRLTSLLTPLGLQTDGIDIVTIGSEVVQLPNAARPVEHVAGSVVETINRLATERSVDVIAMPTAGHHGFLDALRGSTTSNVLSHAPCPVLSLPLIGA